jgi:crossover junction endodeoxyribonuclease RusA
VRVTLPWPDKHLSPNARCHWAVKARATKDARHAARVLTLQATKMRRPKWDGAALHWEFHPKTRNTPDDDNAKASTKAFRDGIADALGIDDSKFQTTYSMGSPVKGGAVIVTIRGIE